MKFSAKNQTFHKLHYFGFGISRNGIFFSVSALLAEMKMDVTVIFGIGRNEKKAFRLYPISRFSIETITFNRRPHENSNMTVIFDTHLLFFLRKRKRFRMVENF